MCRGTILYSGLDLVGERVGKSGKDLERLVVEQGKVEWYSGTVWYSWYSGIVQWYRGTCRQIGGSQITQFE